LNCASCENGSIPRERALMLALISLRSNWRELAIHESSPTFRGISALLRRECSGYVPTYCFPPDVPLERRGGFRHEDLEQQTFGEAIFDLVITLDVMEHVFRPELVYREVWRTLRPSGIYLHTTPIYKDQVDAISCRAIRNSDGSVQHLAEPEYHGDPINSDGTLCTFHFGYDLAAAITEWAPFDVEIRRYDDRTHGIIGEFTEVIICRKRAQGE
jgi:SAM-dependent methyltransferase